ncbi:ABC transporter permease [Micromonospora sp. NPDC048830]|uniref:ABC transporter permease n=1 Tax=Micromonospora sp. NPDC048830 TaxID=3364257 RepID=UPI0037184EDB
MTSVAPTAAGDARMKEATPTLLGLRRVFARQEVSLLLVVLAIGFVASLRSPLFLTHSNILQVLEGSVIYFVMACGSALLVIGGGLDFSVGATFTLGGLVTAKLLASGVPVPLAILIGLSICVVVGAVNYCVITYWHVPPIIATLGVFYVLVGVTTQLTDGLDVVPLPYEFELLAQSSVAGIPNTVIFAVLAGLATWFLLEHTAFGVNIRALGGNRGAAIGNGLPVGRLDFAVYAAAAITAGAAGILYASRVGSGQVNAGGATSTLMVITAVLIGGVSLLGGLGSIQGVAIGSVLLSLIDNALVLTRVPPTYNSIIIGAILVGAVALDHLRRVRLYRRR